jgi:hypothetical protein
MKDSLDDQDSKLRIAERSNPTFGRTELYLLLLLLAGGIAIDYWSHPQQTWRSPTEQPAGLNPAFSKWLL